MAQPGGGHAEPLRRSSIKYGGQNNEDITLGRRFFEPGATNGDSPNIASVSTTSYTVDPDDDVIFVDDDTAGGVVTISLEAVATRTKKLRVKKLGSTAKVIIDADGAELIDDEATIELLFKGEAIDLLPNTTAWRVMA